MSPPSRQRVAVNLLWLVPGDVGGSEESTTTTLRGLAELAPPDLTVELVVLRPFLAAHPDLAAAFPTRVLPTSGRSRALRIAAESTWLAGATRSAHLVHHAGGTAPPLEGHPYVLTLHDLQPLERTATHGAGKRAYLALTVPRSLARARRVLVPSAFVRATVLEHHPGLDPDAVAVVPHAVPPVPAVTPEAELRARHGLDGPVVLYPAITYPHKNHVVLVEAFAEVRRRHPDALLVLTGRADSAEAAVADRIAELGLGAAVRRLGRVPAADVAGLYRLAAAVAVPSRYEGFGLPALEAMAAGAPVVAADATALPEVVGDAARLVDPDDPAAWAEALAALLEDPRARAALAQAGARRAAACTPRANAAAVVEAYRSALRMGGGEALL